MKPYCTFALLLVSVSTLSAQTVPPALMVQKDGHSVPLGLTKLRTEVRIMGAVAETTTTMTFANDTAQPMEGDLYFPLPEGSTISNYALDINGAMIDGVAVEKHEARRIFEEVERRGIDPGLVQWTIGNNFQTRVFPIPAHGSRTVRVAYVSELIGGKEAPAYHLPLKYKEKIGDFSLRVEVVKAANPPRVTKGELANFAFEKWHDSYVAETKQQDWLPVEDLVIALPKVEGPQVLVEKADDGQTYFAVQDYPAAPAVEAPVAQAKRVVVFWDASGSRSGDHAREIAVLQGYLNRLLPDPAVDREGKIAVDLVLLRNTASKPVRIEYSKPDHSRLAEALGKIEYDGGTQLGEIGPIAGSEKPDLYLLFTDGISNFGSEEPARLDAPLFIFSADSSANHAFLQGLAMTNGGQYFNLANEKDADILARAGRAAWSFQSALVTNRDEKDLYPRLPQPLSGHFMLAGKLNQEEMTVVVNYGIPGAESQQRTFVVRSSDAVEGTLLRRLWAQKKLAHLMIHQKENEKEIAALGKQFGLVTPYTSLLVLDSLEQYVQYEIAPPKSLAAMREEYMRRIDTVEHQKLKEKADKLAEVVRMWDNRVKWWNTEFNVAKDFKYQAVEQKPGEARLESDGMAPRAGNGAHDAPVARVPAPEGLPRPAAAAPATPAPAAPALSVAAPAADSAPAAAHYPLSPVAGRDSRLAAGAVRQRQLLRDGEEMLSEKGKDEKGPESAREPGIVIKPWQPDMPYLKELRAAKGKDLFAVYMKNRAQFGTSPAFFLDCADFFREAGDNELALQVLSNIAELELEDAALLRVLGHRLVQIGQLDLAVQTFEHVLELRPEEPQSYRDLALALARRADDTAPQPMHEKVRLYNGEKTNFAAAPNPQADYTRAIELLAQLVMRRWDARFPEIEVIALEEVNRILPRAKAAGVSVIPLDERLIKLLDVDVRIVMTWHADNTDVDLWVTEPTGEKAMYNHNRTTIGGLVSCDFTQGYGPEEYLIHRAAHGVYKIEANYFGSRATQLLGPVTVQVDVYTNYGRPNEQRKSLTLRLKEAKETVRIGEIEF
jgi:Ca-activated chloride channel homolog